MTKPRAEERAFENRKTTQGFNAAITANAQAESALQKADFQQAAAMAAARLELAPADLSALLVLGDAAVEMERFAEAADAFGRALRLEAANVRALNGLAIAALGSRDPETALGYAQRARAAAPTELEPYLALGPAAICMQDQVAIDASFSFLARTSQIACVRLQRFWAQTLAYLEKFEYAAALFEPLARSTPRDFDNLFTLAYYLLRAHRLEDARDCIETLAVLRPNAPEPHDLLGELAMQTGDLELSRAAARRALVCDAKRASAYLTLAKINPAEIDESELCILTSILHAEDNAVPSRFAAGLALGLALESRGDYDAAFGAFSEANGVARAAALRAGIGYEPTQTEAQVALIKRLFPRDRFSRPLPGLDRGGDLVFVLGMPRSGTTLVDQILASHSQVGSVGENSGMTRLFDTFLERVRASNEDAETVLVRHAEEWRTLYRRTLNGADSRATRVVDKMLMNFWSIGLISRLFPDAKIVLLQRDPMDVCLSVFRLNFLKYYAFSNDLGEIAHYHRCFDDICAHWLDVLPGAIKVVQYEELLEDFEGRVADLLRYCGLAMEPGCLSFHETKRPVFTLSAAQVRKGLDRGASGRWRRYERHLGVVRSALGGG